MALHPRCNSSSMEREELEEKRKDGETTRAVEALEAIAEALTSIAAAWGRQ